MSVNGTLVEDRLSTVQVPNLARTHTKRITVQVCLSMNFYETDSPSFESQTGSLFNLNILTQVLGLNRNLYWF